MGKTVGTLAIGALAVGAAFATGGASLVPTLTTTSALTGATITAGGFLATTALGSTLLTLGVTTALSAGLSALAPKPKSAASTASGFSSQVSIDPQSPQWLTIGETAVPARLIYFGTDGTNNTNLSQIFVHACHAISGVVGLKIGDEDTVYSPSVAGQYAGCLEIEVAGGTHTSNPFTSVHGGQWTSAHIGRDLTMSHWRWTYDSEKLASGLPSNVQFLMKGIKVYDPRRDSTRGGSGSMRADNRSTWAYAVSGDEIGRNPALVELTYRLGWTKNSILWAGMGENPANIDFASFIAAANVCDETVNGKKRYQINGNLSLSDTHNDNLTKIHGACGGRSTDVGGLIGFWVMHDDTASPVMTLTDDDLVGDESWEPLPESLRNTARGSFIDPSNGYAAQPYADVAPGDLRTIDNSVELADGIDFPLVTDVDQARRAASIRIRESRQGVYAAPFALKTLGLKPAQIIARTSARKGWSSKKFRVESMSLAIDKVQLSLSAVQSSDYADIANVTPTTTADLQTLGYMPVLGDMALADNAAFGDNIVNSSGTVIDDDDALNIHARDANLFTDPLFERAPSGLDWQGWDGGVHAIADAYIYFDPISSGNRSCYGYQTAISPGQRLDVECEIQRSTTGVLGDAGVLINWYDAAGAFLSSAWGAYADPAILGDGAFVLFKGQAVAPPGAYFVLPVLQAANPGTGLWVMRRPRAYVSPAAAAKLDEDGRGTEAALLPTQYLLGPGTTVSALVSASDAGSSATITVPAHTRKVSGVGSTPRSVSYNSGTLTGRAYDTSYLVFCDDPDLVGGAVTYQTTTTSDDLLVAGRYHVATITTPTAGGGGTSGSGGSGSSAPPFRPGGSGSWQP